MLYLGIKTDSPEATFYIYEGNSLIGQKSWRADRELAKGLLAQLETFLAEYDLRFEDLSGLFIFKGPGSFTGLRIGMTVMNTLAYGLAIPIAGGIGEKWIELSIACLTDGGNDVSVQPYYGADPRITKPIK